MISYKTLKNDRQWRATTGLNALKFHRLCKAFQISYESHNGVSLTEGASRLGVSLILPTYEDCLFLVLFQLKNGLSYDNLGFLIGADGNTAQINFEKYQEILEKALISLNALPKRGFTDVSEFETYLKDEEFLIVDGSEQATNRPKGYEKQKEKYSGKKKTHTNKELIISNSQRRILYVSPTFKGKAHDFDLLKTLFPPEKPWFAHFHVRLDLGFQGFAALYVCKKLSIPEKKKRVKKGENNDLTLEQKIENKAQAQERIFVEHSIGGMKRYRILVHRNRLKKEKILNQIIGICAGLWNFSIES